MDSHAMTEGGHGVCCLLCSIIRHGSHGCTVQESVTVLSLALHCTKVVTFINFRCAGSEDVCKIRCGSVIDMSLMIVQWRPRYQCHG